MATAVTTCQSIRKAQTSNDVLELVRGYISSLDGEKAALLPASVVSLCVDHAHEIAASAIEIAQREARAAADGPEAELLKDVGTVLSTAAMRLMVLATGVEG